jgi:CRP-like cAMP-binding protein
MLELLGIAAALGAGMCARRTSETRSPVSFWRRLNAAERDAFTAMAKVRRFHKGDTLIGSAQAVRWAGILQRGQVRVVEDNQILETRSEGDIFGEGVVIDDLPRSTAVIASADVHVLVLGRAELERVVTQNPRVMRVLCAVIDQRLHSAYRRLIDQADEALAKVVRELLRGAEERGHPCARGTIVDIGSQKALAELLGISRHSVVRALQRLRAENILSTHRRLVTVHDIELLRTHAAR